MNTTATLLLTAALLSASLNAQEKPTLTPTPGLAPYESYYTARLRTIKDMSGLLQGVQDTATAEAAVPALRPLCAELLRNETPATENHPDSDAYAAYEAKAMAELFQAAEELSRHIERLMEADCYASPALKKLLDDFIHGEM